MIPAELLMLPGPGDVNPANHSAFPWLAHMAGNFEKYRFRSLSYRFQPTVSSSTNGRYYASFDYDVDDPVPVSLQNMMSCRTNLESSIWLPSELRVDTRLMAEGMPWRYTHVNSRLTFQEPRTAYAGCLYLAFRTPTTNVALDVWCDYSIELSAPCSDIPDALDTYAMAPSSAAVECDPTGTGTKYMYWCNLPADAPATAVRTILLRDIPDRVNASIPDTGRTYNDSLLGPAAIEPKVWDISGCNRRGKFTLRSLIQDSAKSYADWATAQMEPVIQVLDSVGEIVGTLNKAYLTANNVVGFSQTGVSGTESASATNTSHRGVIEFWLSQVCAKFPTARYLLPMFMAAVQATTVNTVYKQGYHLAM